MNSIYWHMFICYELSILEIYLKWLVSKQSVTSALDYKLIRNVASAKSEKDKVKIETISQQKYNNECK